MIIIIINMIEHHHQIIVKRHHDSKVLKLIRSEACWAGQLLPEGEPCHFHYPVIIKHEQQFLLILILVYHHKNDHHQNSCCPEMNRVTYNWTWTNYNWIIDSWHCLTDWPFHFERHTERSSISEINKKNINVFVVDCWLLAENNCLVREVYITLGRQQLASSG